MLEQRDAVPAPLLSKLLNAAAVMASVQGDYSRASDLHSESLAISKQLEDRSNGKCAQ